MAGKVYIERSSMLPAYFHACIMSTLLIFELRRSRTGASLLRFNVFFSSHEGVGLFVCHTTVRNWNGILRCSHLRINNFRRIFTMLIMQYIIQVNGVALTFRGYQCAETVNKILV